MHTPSAVFAEESAVRRFCPHYQRQGPPRRAVCSPARYIARCASRPRCRARLERRLAALDANGCRTASRSRRVHDFPEARDLGCRRCSAAETDVLTYERTPPSEFTRRRLPWSSACATCRAGRPKMTTVSAHADSTTRSASKGRSCSSYAGAASAAVYTFEWRSSTHRCTVRTRVLLELPPPSRRCA